VAKGNSKREKVGNVAKAKVIVGAIEHTGLTCLLLGGGGGGGGGRAVALPPLDLPIHWSKHYC
jgi:hypothetical protein